MLISDGKKFFAQLKSLFHFSSAKKPSQAFEIRKQIGRNDFICPERFCCFYSFRKFQITFDTRNDNYLSGINKFCHFLNQTSSKRNTDQNWIWMFYLLHNSFGIFRQSFLLQ